MIAKELCFVIDQISKEKGITRLTLLKVLESALLSAARKKFAGKTNLMLRIDPKTCEIRAFDVKRIVETVEDDRRKSASMRRGRWSRTRSPEMSSNSPLPCPISDE
ncbi:MAG: hypothetical protein MZU91_04975 [Desulfosudis oleivorans]|nr:hypothetical protein [Desulfosudis oleivorans]